MKESPRLGGGFSPLTRLINGNGLLACVAPQFKDNAVNETQSGQITEHAVKRSTGIAVGLVILLAAVAVTAAWWWKARDGQPATGPATARVARRDFASAVQATGAVKPQVGAEVRVGARISGKLHRLPANIGDSVTQGQVIAELDKADLEAVVAQRRADVAVGEARAPRKSDCDGPSARHNETFSINSWPKRCP